MTNRRGRPPKMEQLLDKLSQKETSITSEMIHDMPVEELSTLIQGEYQGVQTQTAPSIMGEYLDPMIDYKNIESNLEHLEAIQSKRESSQLRMLGQPHEGFNPAIHVPINEMNEYAKPDHVYRDMPNYPETQHGADQLAAPMMNSMSNISPHLMMSDFLSDAQKQGLVQQQKADASFHPYLDLDKQLSLLQTRKEIHEQKTENVLKNYEISWHNDCLNYLLSKYPNSFGWVIKPSFFYYFNIDPQSFDVDEEFVLFISTRYENINIKRSAGDQNSEDSKRVKIPAIFLIKYLDDVQEDDVQDKWAVYVNDDRLIRLREILKQNCVDFVYHIEEPFIFEMIESKLEGKYHSWNV